MNIFRQNTPLILFILRRWEILTEILEAQKLRISTFGIEINGRGSDDKMDTTVGTTTTSLSSDMEYSSKHGYDTGDDESEKTPKKRKITSSKRIQFETLFAKISTSLQSKKNK